MKNLVICPDCQANGTKSILGEIDDDGYFSILRFHRAYTRIKGKDFAVICGVCNEPTYIRKEADGTSSINRITWFFGQTIGYNFGTSN